MRTLTRTEAIYAAVHEEFMRVRIALYRQPGFKEEWDHQLAQAMDRAGQAAIEAFKRPLRPARVNKRRKAR